MKKRLLLLTGMPGVGKTTIVSRAVLDLRRRGLSVGGVCSKESKSGGRRVGFYMVDLMTDTREALAALTGEGPRLGRYRVNLKGLAEFAARAITEAIAYSDVVVVDEVGPMELLSPEFRRAVDSLVESAKPGLLVVHETMKEPLMEKIRGREDAELVQVTLENRDGLLAEVFTKLLELVPP